MAEGAARMTKGTVLWINSKSAADSAERILTGRNPGIHMERAENGSQALMIQSLMRPQVVVMSMNQPDMTGEHLICELKRDIARPYIIVCMRMCSAKERGRILRMGANEIMQEPLDGMELAERIEERMKMCGKQGGLSEAMLQRIFADTGVPFDLKGYRYLKCALMLLESGEARLEPIGMLYERIGEQYGCLPTAVERSIRYAVGQCTGRMEAVGRIGSREFITRLMEKAGTYGMCSPRVSVFSAGRRLFR